MGESVGNDVFTVGRSEDVGEYVGIVVFKNGGAVIVGLKVSVLGPGVSVGEKDGVAFVPT